MATDQAIEELEEAMNHIEEAKRLSDTEVSRIEIRNAKQMCQDAIDGLNMDKVYHDVA
ncbi:MAG: hypothetical protein ACI9YT_000855 [Halobacteriales archaeon]|jgi:hypothetical protein